MSSHNILIPSDPIDYLIHDRFNRVSVLHGDTPTYSKAGSLWVVNAFIDPDVAFACSASGWVTGEADPSTPAANDYASIDAGESYNNMWLDCLIPNPERLSVFMHTTQGQPKNHSTHKSFEFRMNASDVSGNYGNQLDRNNGGTKTDLADDGTLQGDGTNGNLVSSVSVNQRIKISITYKNGFYTARVGEMWRRFQAPVDLSANTFAGFTFSSNAANCKIFDFRVW